MSFKFLAFLFVLHSPLSHAVTSMELRIMQTRIFEADPQSVVDAINNLCLDSDLQGGGRLTKGGIVCNGVDTKPGTIARLVFTTKSGAKIEDTETTIRIRAYLRGDYGALGDQVKDPDHYSTIFDQLAQHLFINAIPWEPPVQH